MLRRLFYPTAVLAMVIGAIWAVSATALAGSASRRSSKTTPTTHQAAGGITVYQAENTRLNVNLGPQSSPTTLVNKKIPAGKYYVAASIGVNVQPGSFIVCAISSTGTLQFGVYNNQTPYAAVENVQLSQVVTLQSGQNLKLTCDDNAGKPHNNVGAEIVDAIPATRFIRLG